MESSVVRWPQLKSLVEDTETMYTEINVRGTHMEVDIYKFLNNMKIWDTTTANGIQKHQAFQNKIKEAENAGEPVFVDLDPEYFRAILNYHT